MVESMPEDPCEWGMTVKQLLEFGAETLSRSCEKLMDEDDLSNDFCDLYEMNNKGENISELKGPKWINMYDTVTQYVKPLTKEANLSLAVFLNKECPKKATVFISHSWAEKLLYFVCILCGSLMADTTFGWIAKSLGWKHGMLSPGTPGYPRAPPDTPGTLGYPWVPPGISGYPPGTRVPPGTPG
eukprot:gnl/TRDRNA2_/TRDRNA2_151214_c0_seq1.p2 gnl/TRDRNA2_/TRDRNA2_151214_c0~~gnl/TRDRNA2_/TRDRNA2_151214_c0_seq1.p2  ORF type:complete len:185 (-),score=6.55 gnl/TRDRNA2_/TRDRNA2_151214_c0_seq1:35-589(-)